MLDKYYSWDCGTERGPESIIERNECKHCHAYIYRTKDWPNVWRHSNGFCVCIDLYSPGRTPSAEPKNEESEVP